MNKLVVLSLGNGDLRNGFPAVTAQLWEPGNPQPMKFTGNLPAAPEIPELYRYWQLLYLALHQRLDLSVRIEIVNTDVTNVSEVEFSDLCQRLSDRINDWLNSELFRNIDQQLRTYLDRSDEICFIIETNDHLVRRLPWHLWNFFEHYPKAEVALSASEYQRPNKIVTKTSNAKVRILAILGNSQGIDIGKDRAFLQQLSDKAETKFLVEPQRQDLNDELYNDWDILFFAGHSSSKEKGLIQLNQTDAITLDQLRYTLKKAISRGLKLAIFNSCDGLGLAQALFDLHIPQVIVMREPVPDVVAQEFLRHFLWSFSGGQSLYASVRSARERLQRLEGEYPCATWLPIICQNPAFVPTSWQDWYAPKNGDRSFLKRCLRTMVVMSVVVSSLVIGMRQLGWLQSWELQAFDTLMRLRPDEGPDPRLLVVTVTEQDVQNQPATERLGASVSDQTLAQLLEKLESYQPRVIGLDVYREHPVIAQQANLSTRLRHSDRFIAICKAGDSENNLGVSPPPEIPPQRLGFSDVVGDLDGILRRQLLAMAPASPCNTDKSLSLRLATRYLADEGIQLKLTQDDYFQLGTIVLKTLEENTGGYHQLDARGHQVLLNYRSSDRVATQVTLTDVLNNKLSPELVKDRLVLIGTTAESFHDYWLTPYSAGQLPFEEMPGVIVQAHMVSQLLSTVLDNRPLFWFWSKWGEAFWIFCWSVVGGLLALRVRSLVHLGLAGGAALGTLYGVCFILLIQGGWVPLVPSALALVATGGTVVTHIAFQLRNSE